VRTDVDRLLAVPQLSSKIKVSGHVYDLDTGLVTTVIEPTTPGCH
jgi:carbonic anhydrase